MRGQGGDEGSASVLVLALCSLLALVGAVLVALGAVAVARHRAGAAADSAALAAAARALGGEQQACASAAAVVRASGATLLSCALHGDAAEVTVEVRPPGRLGQLGAAHARARAGPAPGSLGPVPGAGAAA